MRQGATFLHPISFPSKVWKATGAKRCAPLGFSLCKELFSYCLSVYSENLTSRKDGHPLKAF